MLSFVALILAFFAFSADSESCNSQGAVRLVWGAGNWQGNIQICINGTWGWICHNSFDTVDAQVVCTQLGYTTAGVATYTGSFYGWGNGTIWMDYVSCTGTETTLYNCGYLSPNNTYCSYNNLAGVACQSGGSCTNQDIRLMPYYSYDRSLGVLEVCINNQWGTVCHNGFDWYDARAACKQLGFYEPYTYWCCAYLGQGFGAINMREVSCSSNSLSLFSCSYISNSYGCYHSYDIGIRCYGYVSDSCVSGQVRLWRPYDTGPSNEGIALYCRDGYWKSVCDRYFSCYTAKIMCQEMGYPGALTITAYTQYGLYYDYDVYVWSCTSSDTSLSQCYTYYNYYYYYYNCNDHTKSFGLICYSPTQGTACTNGALRLTNGTTPNEGRVEYCYEGEWAPFCDISPSTASVICNQLGYNYTYASIFDDERFGRNNALNTFKYKHCSSGQQYFSECTEVRKGTDCYFSYSRCTTEYGLRCYNPGACSSDGEVQLVNGTIEQEGRVEICLNGVWGAICETGWSTNDAYVLCKGLGYSGQNPLTYFDAHFGETNGPVIWSNLACSGWETSIHNCNKDVFPNFNCTQQNTAGVTCKDACQNGDIKLFGGKYSNEGTVLVCYNSLWGLISDAGWSEGDAEVVCNKLGYSGGIADPVHGSYYGKPKLIVHFRDVSCFGHETSITQCSKTTLSFNSGKLASASASIAGVDCLYDEPSECIRTPDWVNTPGSECNINGNIRLIGSQQVGNGRLEYCYNGYWSPFCNLDPVAASVVCKQQGFTNYSAASIIPTNDFGTARNFSLFKNITCTGTESAISQCTIHTSECTPWCALSNIAITCFNPGMCTNGEIRLVDGVIENEGRVEVCYNGVWGAVCDQGWDSTDGHVACTQMGHPELEPVVFTNSTFGAGKYPIVYTNFDCGGWENTLTECDKQIYPQSVCSRKNVAGVLCGYDCNDGDVRLVGSEWSYEGTLEVCYSNIWGLISDSGWNQQDAEVVCRQLGYQTQGTIIYYNSYFGKPNKTIHLSDIVCTGNEDKLNECTLTSLSLQQGKDMFEDTSVAGVKCYTPDQCITPPNRGTQCAHGNIRLTGGQASTPEGNLEYCYYGSWSKFCYLGPLEAVVACRQLGYTNYEITAIFNDGRFGSSIFASLFQNFSCANEPTATSLTVCVISDRCQSNCQYPIGLRCYESDSCLDGAVRLINGTSDKSGRLEVCSRGVWGSVCGTGFDVTDAYVVCRKLGLGISEPTVYLNSYFGDGNQAIVYSNINCGGFEGGLSDCEKQQYGSFTCSRNNIVGIVCRDNCSDSDIRLVSGNNALEGTVEVCYYNTWGLVSDNGWSNKEAQVVCRQLNYNATGATGVSGSHYGKPNRTIQLTNVVCNGSEEELDRCQKTLLTPENGVAQFSKVNVAGVNCWPTYNNIIVPSNPSNISQSTSVHVSTPIMGVLGAMLAIAILIIISFFIYILVKHRQVKKLYQIQQQLNVRMSSLTRPTGLTGLSGLTGQGFVNPLAGQGVQNPLAGLNDEDFQVPLDTSDEGELMKNLESQY